MAKAKEETAGGEPDQVSQLKGQIAEQAKRIKELETLLDEFPTQDLQQLQASLGNATAENAKLKSSLARAQREQIGGTVYIANQDLTMDGMKISEGQAIAISRVPIGNLDSALRLKQIRAQSVDADDDD